MFFISNGISLAQTNMQDTLKIFQNYISSKPQNTHEKMEI